MEGGSMDNVSEARLCGVHPYVARKVRELAAHLEDEGIVIRVVQAFRSYADQDKLYAQGRTAPGEIVTRCVPGNSWHNYGLAVDVAPFTRDGVHAYPVPDWNATHPAWHRIEEVGVSLGFVAGANFRTFPDNPHLQITGRFPVNPSCEVRHLFFEGGVAVVWEESGIKMPGGGVKA